MIERYTAPTPNGHKASIALDIAELMDAKREEDAEEFSKNARSMLVGAQSDAD